MTLDRAMELEAQIMDAARQHFQLLHPLIRDELAVEDRMLTSEITDALSAEFANWVTVFPRLGRPSFSNKPDLVNEWEQRRIDARTVPYVMFSRYYANLFFGVRQAAEIDCLRYAIDQLPPGFERDWAMGVLICATSACADTYGGHFAQPRLNVDDLADVRRKMPETFVRRVQSVSHEFSARFLSLAKESQKAKHQIEVIDGPWEKALSEITARIRTHSKPLVYVDPPYTRDEYSRYYHVLESLVRYDYPTVSGKASVPPKGSSRFASEFFTRDTVATSKTIIKMLSRCLQNGWPVLWSYSSGGVIDDVREILVATQASAVELYAVEYAYKLQGKRQAKQVVEYFFAILP